MRRCNATMQHCLCAAADNSAEQDRPCVCTATIENNMWSSCIAAITPQPIMLCYTDIYHTNMLYTQIYYTNIYHTNMLCYIYSYYTILREPSPCADLAEIHALLCCALPSAESQLRKYIYIYIYIYTFICTAAPRVSSNNNTTTQPSMIYKHPLNQAIAYYIIAFFLSCIFVLSSLCTLNQSTK